ncbi:hypothetical protein [Novosphingobium sp.]|uniref:hypothetical protein n=1 Tax=Novosphingobium sp. TaxID=1874826 RepID=UPI002621EE24|nr:hypothetical protein [Novosphingobium sp.]
MTGTLFTDWMVFGGSGAALFPGEVVIRGEQIDAAASTNRPSTPQPRATRKTQI